MGTYGECTICGDKINYAPDNVANLGLHLIDKHPDIELAHFSLLCESPPKAGCQCGCGCACNPSGCGAGRGRKQPSIKTTVESWKRAQNPLRCVKCGKTAIPLIRRQRHKLARSQFGAFILLGCWPICFLPFILGGSDLMYLYCKECGNYLGMYDRRVAQKDDPLCRQNGHPCSCN
ncbi:PREDICTED: uncharacterized protein LOC108562391 [Nicrophorus vespilloides]|uniref:Uncharacterized protein LOC108562391 n=1 Tax=Nicrophorus vespilloides TaxID=110193 RepID=A0ABM1MNP5_NICVS|nr:PREDICTED: uncharacterized protein LOC108562391 [Nicrophorus vespilloides]XP_017776194.1 PREDICTED: uncharacterized protein LOC108562391 [Nicrophorus vespilloides]XP_017776195.1 PREDICTED: uncharacterized protein LOC108562391 [Nicrophorus vespilloides]